MKQREYEQIIKDLDKARRHVVRAMENVSLDDKLKRQAIVRNIDIARNKLRLMLFEFELIADIDD